MISRRIARVIAAVHTPPCQGLITASAAFELTCPSAGRFGCASNTRFAMEGDAVGAGG